MKFVRAMQFALAGLWEARNHPNFLKQLGIGAIALAGGVVLELSSIEWAVLIVIIGFVLSAEVGNSAIEEVVNLMSREHRREAKLAKDFGAGMVLLSALTSVIVGLFLFLPHLLPQ